MARQISQALTALVDEFFPSSSGNRAGRRQMQIVDAAIGEFARNGIEDTTYEAIARKCKISRPLVQHYFPTRERLFHVAANVIRVNFQKLAIDAILAQPAPEDQIGAYVRSHFEWVRKYRDHGRVWLLFYHRCAMSEEYRALNTELVLMGHRRIAALIAQLREKKEEEPILAKIVQSIITGAVIAALTEKLPISLEELEDAVVGHCLRVARG